MKLVFLDAKTIGDDIDLSAFDQLGEVVKYSFSQPEEVPERVTDADVLIVNKIRIDEAAVKNAGILSWYVSLPLAPITWIKHIWRAVASPGEMWQTTPQNPWPSTPLPCCFSCWKSCVIMTNM